VERIASEALGARSLERLERGVKAAGVAGAGSIE